MPKTKKIDKAELIQRIEDSKWRYKMAREIKKNPTKKYQELTEAYLKGLDVAIYFINQL